jgi:hypothetical protein
MPAEAYRIPLGARSENIPREQPMPIALELIMNLKAAKRSI